MSLSLYPCFKIITQEFDIINQGTQKRQGFHARFSMGFEDFQASCGCVARMLNSNKITFLTIKIVSCGLLLHISNPMSTNHQCRSQLVNPRFDARVSGTQQLCAARFLLQLRS